MKSLTRTLCGVALVMLSMGLWAADDILIADFEGSYGQWKADGDAFGPAPAKGKIGNQQAVSGYVGKGLVNTFLKGDRSTGSLTSPEFKVERKYITFLIGGGAHKGTCMELLIDGKVVGSQSGRNDELLMPAVFDVEKYRGKTAQLRIVDNEKGGWGHVNVDHIVQSNDKPKMPKRPGVLEKEFTIENKYLIMPIKNGGKKGSGSISLYVDDEEVRRYKINIAPDAEQTDWYAFFTIDMYKGKKARVVAKATEEGFALITPSDTIPGEENFYKEPHRPQYHFTQKVGWNNDPNGMVYHDGKWHFFFQHNPVALPWGNMTWGHATSKDLLHWAQQPNKLYPWTMAKGACFSGGATVDHNNSSGWGKHTLVAYFTDTGCGECIAYSTNGGETFTYYEKNPVVKHKGRDPKVIWYAYDENDTPLNEKAKSLGGHWVMAVYDEKDGKNIAFYTSTDMKAWDVQSHLMGYFECPELFELPIRDAEGKLLEPKETRWVTYAADAKYAIGTFDGKTFKPEHEGKHQLFWGNYYAAQTFDNPPDGRKIQIGWTRKLNAPGPYNQHFSFPHRFTLRKLDEGIRMYARPVKEIEKLRVKTNRAEAQALSVDQAVAVQVGTDLLDVRLVVEVGQASAIELKMPGRTVTYDVKGQKLSGAQLKPVDGKVSIQVLADRLLTETIGNDGRIYITSKGEPETDERTVTVTAKGGDTKLISLEAHELKSIWNK